MLVKVLCTWERYDWRGNVVQGAGARYTVDVDGSGEGYWYVEVPEVGLITTVAAMSPRDRDVEPSIRRTIEAFATSEEPTFARRLEGVELELDIEFRA